MTAYPERRDHLALLLAVKEVIVILHGDERRQAVRQGVICGIARSALRSRDRPAGLAERWTNFAWRGLAREGH